MGLQLSADCPCDSQECIVLMVLCRLGKVAITAACGLLAFGLSDLTYYTDPVNHADTYLSSPLMPVLVSVLAGYTISNLFLQVSQSQPSFYVLYMASMCHSYHSDAKRHSCLVEEVAANCCNFGL